MKNIWILCAAIVVVSCQQKEELTRDNITQVEDYQKYLDEDESATVALLKKDVEEIKSEIDNDSTRIGMNSRIASKLNQLFDLTGDVEYLNESVRLRESITRNTYIKTENSKRALAQAYIKQHRFKKADSLMRSFTKEYSSPDSQLIQFDISMELGDYKKAEKLLDSLRDPNDYNYLIRAAKWNDHIGQLGTTITLMERAKELADQSGNQGNQLWSYSNIADYYGHHGDLEKSYEYYLKTLEIDPSNTYALKGIAWIAYSNDRDVDEARTILKRISERHPLPDYNLELAELEEFEGNPVESKTLKADFMQQVDNPAYGNMYNAYKIIELADAGNTQAAVDLAKLEIENRATPETYDLLGYALLSNGNLKEALENHKKHVIGKTFEPKAQFHTAMIYKANGMIAEAAELKKELLETEYEMGPVAYKNIQDI